MWALRSFWPVYEHFFKFDQYRWQTFDLWFFIIVLIIVRTLNLTDEELDKRIKQKLLDEERNREPDSDDDYDDISRTEAERKMARLKRRRRRRTDEDLSEGICIYI